MRYISVYCLKEGMLLAKNLYGKNNELLLSHNTVLKTSYIESIKRLGYNGIYIEDSISKDLVVESIISDDLKVSTLTAIKNVFIHSEEKDFDLKYEKMQNLKLLIEEIVTEILNNKNAIINIIDLKLFDDYTFYHSVNVAVLSIVIGVAINLNKSELSKLGLAALMHDIGKIFIDKNILEKNSSLTAEEYDEMKKHSSLGYDYLKKLQTLPIDSLLGILEHHEKFDGFGYPNQKKGEDINLLARIICLADVFDALISDRPYRKAMLASEAIELIMGGSGTIFDPNLVSVFIRKVAAYPIGTCVKLSNGLIGIVVENYEEFNTRPKIRLIESKEGQNSYINLKDDVFSLNITIVEIVKM